MTRYTTFMTKIIATSGIVVADTALDAQEQFAKY